MNNGAWLSEPVSAAMTLRIIIFLYISFIADKYLVLLLPESLEKLPQILSAFSFADDVAVCIASLGFISGSDVAIAPATSVATFPVAPFCFH